MVNAIIPEIVVTTKKLSKVSSCLSSGVVLQGELSAGFQAKFKVGGKFGSKGFIGVNLKGDLASIRWRVGSETTGLFVTQSFEIEASLTKKYSLAKFIKAQTGLVLNASREFKVCGDVPISNESLPWNSNLSKDAFVGVDIGAAFIGGFNIKAGFDSSIVARNCKKIF